MSNILSNAVVGGCISSRKKIRRSTVVGIRSREEVEQMTHTFDFGLNLSYPNPLPENLNPAPSMIETIQPIMRSEQSPSKGNVFHFEGCQVNLSFNK